MKAILIACVVSIAAILLIVGGVMHLMDNAYKQGLADQLQANTLAATTSQSDALKTAIAERDAARAEADALRDQFDTIDKTHAKELQDAKQASADFIADVRAGRIRLHIRTAATTAATASQPHLSAHAASPAAGPVQTLAELDPAAAADLVSITDDGDSGILDLNTCIDKYSALDESLRKAAQPATP